MTNLDEAKATCQDAAEKAGFAHDLYINLETLVFFIERCEEGKARRANVKYVGTAFPTVRHVRIQTYDAKTGTFRDETPANQEPMPGAFYSD